MPPRVAFIFGATNVMSCRRPDAPKTNKTFRGTFGTTAKRTRSANETAAAARVAERNESKGGQKARFLGSSLLNSGTKVLRPMKSNFLVAPAAPTTGKKRHFKLECVKWLPGELSDLHFRSRSNKLFGKGKRKGGELFGRGKQEGGESRENTCVEEYWVTG